MGKKVIQKSGGGLLDVQKKAEIAVRVVGATLNEDIKSLNKILEESVEDDQVSFLVITGILKLLSKKDPDFRSLVPRDDFHFPQRYIKRILSDLENILIKREYHDYSVAVIPGHNIDKKEFMDEVFLGIFSNIFVEIFSGNFSRHDGDDAFIVSTNAKTLIVITLGFELVTEDFRKKLRNVIMDSLDEVYAKSFSGSKTKVWDARRSAMDYFIKQLLVFNDSFLPEDQKIFLRRWKAWFLLEDHYKIDNKKVNRKNLKSEMLSIYKNLT
ncbi:MAG: hypothetical protein KBC42_02760 [Candidatus Pacebacteria bacterium]|nr:hypothetical protein [Candidatus Paceibacterota bacterium]MBP9780822.1 hypothetical protein [Candidatus Paceibacterota bacterium]